MSTECHPGPAERAHYSPPWANTSIIGIAGSSGSGKSSLAHAILSQLNLPWVVILSMDSFYKPLDAEQSRIAFLNEYDFDAPAAIDFDVLVDKLRDIKQGRRAELPIYSFERHNREQETTTVYSPHVLVLEGIFALHDQRVLDMLDLKIFCEAEPDLCLARRLQRDVAQRGRDIEGCIKQWFSFVKPNFVKYVEPQRLIADIIVPRGIENKVAIGMVSDRIHKVLAEKSRSHQAELTRLGTLVEDDTLSSNVMTMPRNDNVRNMMDILRNQSCSDDQFLLTCDQLVSLMVQSALSSPDSDANHIKPSAMTGAVTILQGGRCFEKGLASLDKCALGTMTIHTSWRTGEPELHSVELPNDVSSHGLVLLLDSQMSSGGAALMAVRVLIDHGVAEDRIVFVTFTAGRNGLRRLMAVYPDIRVVLCQVVDDSQPRWIEQRYLGVTSESNDRQS